MFDDLTVVHAMVALALLAIAFSVAPLFFSGQMGRLVSAVFGGLFFFATLVAPIVYLLFFQDRRGDD